MNVGKSLKELFNTMIKLKAEILLDIGFDNLFPSFKLPSGRRICQTRHYSDPVFGHETGIFLPVRVTFVGNISSLQVGFTREYWDPS